VAVGERAQLAALLLAPPRFALARALPASERARARKLAADARAALAAAGSHDPALARRQRQIDAWLAAN
jgi:hypothetical protein